MANTTPLNEEHFLYNRQKTPSVPFDYTKVPIGDAITHSTATLHAHDAYVSKIEWRKQRVQTTTVSMHEFLVLYILEKQKEPNQYQRHSVAIVERLADPEATVEKSDQEAPTSSPPSQRPGLSKTFSSSSSSLSSSDKSKSTLATDIFVFTTNSTGSFIDDYEGKNDILKTLTLPNENISLAKVFAAASAVSLAYPSYQLTGSNCYYFAAQTYAQLHGLANGHGTEVDGPSGYYRGRHFIEMYGEESFKEHHQRVDEFYQTEWKNIQASIARLPVVVEQQKHDKEVNRLAEEAKNREDALQEANALREEAERREDALREEAERREDALREEAERREDALREEAERREDALQEEIRQLRQLLGKGSSASLRNTFVKE